MSAQGGNTKMASDRAELKVHILCLIQMISRLLLLAALTSELAQWKIAWYSRVEGNEYLMKVFMLNIYSLVTFFDEKLECQVDLIGCPKFCRWQSHDSTSGPTCL